MSSLRSKVDETRHRSRATPITLEEEEEDSRMNLLPDVDIEYHATEKRKRDRAMAIDEDEVNKKSCKYKTSASPLLIVSQDSTTAQDSITQDDEEASSLSDRVAKYLSSEYQLEKQEEDISFVCGYDEETSLAAADLHRNSEYKPYRVPKTAMISALSKGGVPSNILNDISLYARLHEIVRQKIVGFGRTFRRRNNKKKRKMESESNNSSSSKKRKDTSDDKPPRSREERILDAMQLTNRMECEDEKGKGIFQAHVCIACDRHIIGTEEICYLTKAQLEKNIHRIGVESYNKFYQGEYNFPKLHPELVKQYKVDNMEGLLLSQRSQYSHAQGGYEACQSCYDSLKKSSTKSPPKFSIANGFVIGYIPRHVFLKNGEMRPMTDILRAMLAPTRAYGYTFSYFGGAQKSIQGHFMFYEVDQTHVGAVVNDIHNTGANPHIHVVLGGRYTPSQKEIVRRMAEVDTKLFTDIMTWFIQESGHRGFAGAPIPEECPQPYIESIETPNDVDDEVDKDTEKQFDGGTYYFSSANAPSSDTGVYDTRLKFTQSLLNSAPPQLLVYGGDYKGGRGLLLENVIPTAFPWGLGGPTMPRRTKISTEACLKHYGRLSLDQFMRGDFCLICHHMLDRQLSYTSGKVKCRANVDGVPVAERISQLTVKDLEDVVSGANTNSTAIQLLSSVSASCKAMGHTSEAAAHWRRIFFALSDRHGLNPFMLTVTPNDLVNFSVRVIALSGKKHEMPSLDATEEECIADFTIRKENRLDFPGACSLNFEGVMQIILSELLAWDSDKQEGSEDGIVGELDAWGMAVEEQARKTLHSHWLLWSKRLAKMRDELFDDDGNMNETARKNFCARIDQVMSSSYTDNEWTVEHKCAARGKVDEVFKECKLQVLRDARHKVLCHDLCGKVMECDECHEKVSTQNIINLALNEWHQNAIKDDETSAKNLTFPLSKERLDIAMYRAAYDMKSGCYKDDKFWGNEDVRRVLQLSGDNEHYALHGPRCFKKGVECTSGPFPQSYNCSTDISIDKEADMLEWYLLDGSIKRRAPWLLLPKRPLGCQYLNTHNVPISTIFNCNSNVIIGDASNTFYLTMYGSKSTQKEDSEKKERILKKLIRRLKRLQMEREQNLIDDGDEDGNQGDFVQGLSMMMSAMNASTSRDVVSSTLAHYLVQHGGERFSASHKPKNLLITQLEELLSGNAVNFTLRRTNKSKADGTIVQWPESLADDYLHRPFELELMCAYEFTERYEKKFYSLKDVDNERQDDITNTEESERHRFTTTHPGHEFAYLEKLRLPAVVVVSLPEGKLCLLKDLELNTNTPSDIANTKRGEYAKIALMMFYPFRKLDDLKKDDSYWKRFEEERTRHFLGQETRFWKAGFEILQNIEDRKMMMQSDKRTRARDPVQKATTVNEDEAKRQQNKDDKTAIPDISHFRDEDEPIYVESDMEGGEEEYDQHGKQWSHNVLAGKAKHITSESLISARLVSEESILKSSDLSQTQEEAMKENTRGEEPLDWFRNRSFPTLLKLISGTLVGVTAYDNIYDDDLRDELSDYNDVDDDVHVITQDDLSQVEETCNIPTLVRVARKVAHQDKVKLDEKQYIAYEIIACTFLLKLVDEGRDKSTILGKYLGSALGSTKGEMDQLVEHLKARGGMDQLLMFLTGPAGAGKSTAVKVAERFCFEFCQAVAVMWRDNTFLFTACSGSAAAIFGGITIHSAANMNGKVSEKARKEWRGNVKILIIDEISYFSDNDLKKLDRKLKDLNGIPNKPFGGQSIIFSGDFRQFEAILAKFQLYDRNGSGLWESSINCVIILENTHRFKNDPEYGEMLTRFWRNDLTQEDRLKINTRVVGRGGVTLPSTFDEDVVYACSTNKERNGIQAGIFRDHILSTHPKISSSELPPDHTIIIEAVVQSKHASSSIGSFTRDRIVHTCGDADCVVNDSKYIDPALRLYVGAVCMCMVDNKRLKDKVPIGNGTLCRVVGIKLNEHAPSHRWQNWDGRKVWTVSAKHVDWVEFEYHPKSKDILSLEGEIKELESEIETCQESQELQSEHFVVKSDTDLHERLKKLKGRLMKEQQSRRFKLDPQTTYPTVKYTDHDLSNYREEAKCKMTQIPVVLADAITGHKLQGMTIPHVIISSWGYFAKNWPYVVISRSTTFEGLYLLHPIDMDKSFAPPRDLVEYLKRAEHLQDHILLTRKKRMAMAELNK